MKKKCPTCKKTVKPGSKYRPFCSERCRLIDLGGWITGDYRINDKEHTDALSDVQTPKTRH